MRKVIFFWGVAAVMLLYSCGGRDFVYHENISIEGEVWTAEHQIPFQFSIADTLSVYTVGLNIRYTLSFPKQNLYVFMHTTFPNGTQTTDTVSINLFTMDGTPFGRGKRIKELDVPIAKIRFPMSGQYSIRLEHGMRDYALDGTASMGLYVRKPQQ
ncbi:MAG: gliding motility lipoprotein GldH [Lentimicrobiaceae bacterium]|nr:gliding motility lipoprotein GldH [Lentimicrobiaceae bacterium]